MNPVIKVITEIIIFLNRSIDRLDRKTTTVIRQSYFLFVFVIVVAGIFIGYNWGKNAAKKFGAPIAEYTGDVFNVMIKQERKNVSFGTMIEGRAIREKEESSLKKQAFPSNEKLEFESNHNIVEPDTESKKIYTGPQADERERAADVKRIDEAEPREDIKELDRRPPSDIDKKESSIIHNTGDNLPVINRLESKESSSPAILKTKPMERKKNELLPMDKNDRVIDK